VGNAWSAFADPTRRKILELLSKGSMTAGEISDHFNMTKSSISHHLSILKNAELVSNEKTGQYVIYSINTTVIQDLMCVFAEFLNKNDEEKLL
jgi:DNA-binding transcriptional ArsR family regulator